MNIFPSIDIYKGNVVRLYKGNYDQVTIYSSSPVEVAKEFEKEGAKYLHIVDLEGARDGKPHALEIILQIKKSTSLIIEVGGGIRNLETISTYLDSGIERVILGTSAIKDENLVKEALKKYGNRILIGVDIKDNLVSINGWKEKSSLDAYTFIDKMISLGASTFICTDVSKDGAMEGTNLSLYQDLQNRFNINIIASGGVSSLEDIKKLRKMNIYGAIIGKAYYTKAISLYEAIEVSK
ncbi:MAG: 1-(5-phosphoribosyl)-5-[(5-phosphoribosylamino)methylideneamino]imidazole-4-carboxamide isomerase [Bacilli bacterium]